MDPAVRQFKVIKFSHSKGITKPGSSKNHFKELIKRKPEFKPVTAAPNKQITAANLPVVPVLAKSSTSSAASNT